MYYQNNKKDKVRLLYSKNLENITFYNVLIKNSTSFLLIDDQESLNLWIYGMKVEFRLVYFNIDEDNLIKDFNPF
jgi:hypothetical protein